MTASLTNMLDDLEARLERTQAELQVLREENHRLKQRLAPDEAVTADQQAPVESAQVDNATNVDSTANVDAALVKPEAPENTIEPEEPEKPEQPEGAAQTPSPHALLNQWYERYPNAFFKGHTKPLKVGIHQDLAEREAWPNKLIRRALANYVNLPRYIKAVRVGVERVDLDGQPAGKVDKEAALHAAQKRGDKQAAGQPKERPPKPKAVAEKPRQEAPKPPDSERISEKSESRKPLSMEDKLLGLQQKFEGR
ncbi:hypothetical protein HVA01_13590 [Halovibrio variabilis]|uniref:ProQ/FinO domain-containing protein n=1 Tax=Halovibrio variabilis TaxID=31910 RepID=A0A511UQD2_9GAMM|nr:ProQ/FINO family protein [Halovibrio variabilis]GEN27713.1 hypothetical protein HVA01_13590 [Halovibrio variabilis]